MMNPLLKLQGFVQDSLYYLRMKDRSFTRQWLSGVLRTSVYHRIEYLIYAYSLQDPLPTFEARLPVTFRVAGPEDLPYLQNIVSPSEFAHFGKRLAHGRICTLALYRGKITAYVWLTDKVKYEIDNLELRLESGDAYIDDAYTLPAYRRQGIQTAMVLQQLRYLQEHGFKRAVAIVAVDNIPSQQVCERLGFKRAGQLSFRRIFLKRDYRLYNALF
jgi:ribosomal protein S18 acetylase RimI-like enzyme